MPQPIRYFFFPLFTLSFHFIGTIQDLIQIILSPPFSFYDDGLLRKILSLFFACILSRYSKVPGCLHSATILSDAREVNIYIHAFLIERVRVLGVTIIFRSKKCYLFDGRVTKLIKTTPSTY